jgi:predicted ATPase
MAILEGIQIQNFRALHDILLGQTFDNNKSKALPRLVAVIGANGSGKSSLMDALGFIGDCLLEGVQSACDKPHRGGFERLRTQNSTEPIKFEIRYRQTSDARPISYSLHINCDKHGRAIVVHERLRQRRKGQSSGQPHSFLTIEDGIGTVWAGEATTDTEGTRHDEIKMTDRQVLGIASLGTLADHPRIAAFREFLSGWYLSYFVPQLARTQPMSGVVAHLDRTGENLANYLQFISREHPAGFKQMLTRIAKKIPGVESIRPVTAQDKRLLLEFRAKGYEQPFFQQDMSDGTLKMLAYMLLMEDPEPAPLIGIEEPENGLHHQLLSDLAQEFKEFARKSRGPQVIITTHAPNFVDALAPEEVWILDKDEQGYSQLTRAADIQGVRELFDEGIPMGSLWYSNHFSIGNP